MRRLIGWTILLCIFGAMFGGVVAEKGFAYAVINFVAVFLFVGIVVLATYLIASDD